MKNRILSILLLFTVLVTLSSCADTPGLSDISVSASSDYFAVGELMTFTVTGTDASNPRFELSDSALAEEITADGAVGTARALAEGELTVTAICGKTRASCTVTVLPSHSETDVADPNVHYLGRTEAHSGRAFINNTASGFAVTFYGKTLSAEMSAEDGEPVFAIFIDSETDPEKRKVNIATDVRDGRLILAEFETAGVHTVQVKKITEEQISRASLAKIIVDGGSLIEYDAPEYSFKMEVYGDSITAGYGNLREEGAADNQRLQNGLLTYSALAAAELNAEYQVFAESGLGLYTNPYGDPDVMKNIYNRVSPESAQTWDMTSYIPDVVVINVGTNDHWATSGSAAFNPSDFTDSYIEFVKELHGIYGSDTVFILCSGMMDTFLAAPISNAVSSLCADGINAISVTLPRSSGGHPTLSVHREAGRILSDIISLALIEKSN